MFGRNSSGRFLRGQALKTSHFAYTILLVQRKFRKTMAFYVCLLVVLGLQEIVVKCTAAIFFCTVD